MPENSNSAPYTSSLTRRGFMNATGMAAAAAAVACGPAAAPAPPSPAPAGGQRTAWEREWDELIAAAKRDGKLSVVTGAGPGYRTALNAFEAAFPGIQIEHEGPGSMGPFSQKIIQERKAGVFDRDIAQIPIITALTILKPAGVWAALRPAIMRPDVLDDAGWQGGFDYGWLDSEKKLGYGWAQEKYSGMFRNADLMPDGAVTSVRQLLDPKWKGKFIFGEPYSYGGTYPMATALRLSQGNDSLKRLFVDQAPISSRDFRQIAEGIVRGTYAFGTTSLQFIDEFRAQGLGTNVREVFDIPELLMVREDAVMLFDRAPHPNAAKLFINWLLSKEGQHAWSAGAKQNSRRTDVAPVNPEKQLTPAELSKLLKINREENLPLMVATQEMLKELLR